MKHNTSVKILPDRFYISYRFYNNQMEMVINAMDIWNFYLKLLLS